MNRGRKEFLGNVVLVAASIILTLFIILSSGSLIGNYAGHWTEAAVTEGE